MAKNQIKMGAILSYAVILVNMIVGLVYTPFLVRMLILSFFLSFRNPPLLKIALCENNYKFIILETIVSATAISNGVVSLILISKPSTRRTL